MTNATDIKTTVPTVPRDQLVDPATAVPHAKSRSYESQLRFDAVGSRLGLQRVTPKQ